MKTIWTILVLMALVAYGPRSEQAGGRSLIQNKGFDTLVNVAQAWAENYKEINPNVAVTVTAGGSGTGISAMINGTVDIANASRKMKDKEIEMARGNGIEPVEWVVSYDALAVYAHKDNAAEGFSLSQLAEIYGEGGATESPCAIGYSGLAYATDEVRMPCIAAEKEGDCVAPKVETAIDRSNPIARPLFMYTAGQPEGAIKEDLDWILGDEGQCIIQNKGYAPVREIACGSVRSVERGRQS